MMKGRAVGSRSIQKICDSRRRERAHQVDAILVGRAQADDGVDHQREEGDERRIHHLRGEAEAEPDDDERRQRHLRHRLEHHDDTGRGNIRRARLSATAVPSTKASSGAEREAEQRLGQRDPEIARDRRRSRRRDRAPCDRSDGAGRMKAGTSKSRTAASQTRKRRRRAAARAARCCAGSSAHPSSPPLALKWARMRRT